MNKCIGLLAVGTFVCFLYGCAIQQTVCYQVFQEDYCITDNFRESELKNFNFIKLKGSGKFKFHEIWISRDGKPLPDILSFKDSENERIFKESENYRLELYEVNTYLTREGKSPPGFYAMFVSKGNRIRGLAFMGPDKEKVNLLYQTWLNRINEIN